MPRSYSHISYYEREILELKEQGLTLKEIGEKLGFTRKQVHNFITRYNGKKRKLESGTVVKPKGRPARAISLPIQLVRRPGTAAT